MKTTLIWLDQCVPGMRLAETLTNNFMAVIANTGTVIDKRMIEKLTRMGYSKIRIFTDSDRLIENNATKAVLKEYRGNIEKMQSILFDIYLDKPIDAKKVEEVSSSMLKRRDDVTGILACLSQMRDADEYTYSHCLNVAYINLMIAKWARVGEDELQGVIEAGLMHDIGKCRIPSEILNKPARLTDGEYAIMKSHPTHGYRILIETPDMRRSTALAALTHHEKTNGTGYPMKLEGDKIPLFGKICAISDIYDAMTSNRVYRKKCSPFEVFQLLEDEAFSCLDPRLVITFLRNLAGYYIGDTVKLSNGDFGAVVFINPRAISRPIVQTDGGVMDLAEPKNSGLKVVELY